MCIYNRYKKEFLQSDILGRKLKVLHNYKPFFKRGPLTERLKCSEYFEENYIFDKNERVTRKFDVKSNISLTCENIKKRRYFSPIPLSKEEKDFPLAYSYLVYTEYEFIELMLSLIYQPQNVYCFSIDGKQSNEFKMKIFSLSFCFDNVFVSDKEYKINSQGLHYSTSHRECLNKIRNYKWKYAFLLQNHDFPLKTNKELVKILTKFNGTSDFKAGKSDKNRLHRESDWTFGGLKIFQNPSSIDKKILKQEIKIAKGYSEITVSRQALDYMWEKLDLNVYQENFDKYHKFGNDELFWSILFSNYEILKIPGTLPSHCINKKSSLVHYTRFSDWAYTHLPRYQCPSIAKRHSICIMGVEYLKTLEENKFLFGNKFMDSTDAGAVDCWSERLFNRTYYPENYKEIDTSVYDDRIQINFQKYLESSKDISGFNCDLKY
uniref:Glycosyltransferase n=1 Tax=Parastrongyloides trichosuri TaxID=131310 RepID=A0A0N4ZEM5_PARTI